ncbi:MAG: alpha-glucosidase/alpha-galactosidase [Phycisphaerae bacterium]|nr:alpha-glucosidase/alpha-galactosidase [Phycisphaerae bacterium]
MAVNVAFIGAGSVGFTRRLFRDILSVPELQDTHFALTDISRRNLDMVARLCQKDLRTNKLPATISSTTDRRRALEGADYVINCTRIGGLEAYKYDIDIPLKYGVDQCVGDTLCIGGVMYGQRNIPCILDFCQDISEVSNNALFLSYANPNAMNTWAANAFTDVEMIGLCHGVEGGHHQIAEVIELLINKGKTKKDKGFVPVGIRDVDIICAGINHQTWYIQVLYNGEDWTGRLLEGFQKHPRFSKTEKVRIDVLRRFGYYSTESNGHLSEYVPWYRKRPKDIKKWISLNSWIGGETGGYLRVSTEGRNWFMKDFPKWLKAEDPLIGPEDRGSEHASYIIEALETGRCYRGHFNVPNDGVITNLPEDCIVEVPVYVDHNGINVPVVGDLPLACAATLSASINVQRMSVYAAVSGDVTLLKQAVLHDPLTAAVCDTEEIWQMVDEMLVAQAQWLPQYKKEIPAARKRLAEAKRKKTYRGTKTWNGAARKKVRTVAQLRGGGEKAKGVLHADKAGASSKKKAK